MFDTFPRSGMKKIPDDRQSYDFTPGRRYLPRKQSGNELVLPGASQVSKSHSEAIFGILNYHSKWPSQIHLLNPPVQELYKAKALN
ncbi:hypothetical protein NPIL_620731 [Nephila pilipes]|uniref:Uncharacterized protein n=1 Tax=Nephila pilipes TaxID=299642 RepID=A0A8X6NT30_NEPPI|nr:hypothetical protein NPIL_620731 [Nephila pilipes]